MKIKLPYFGESQDFFSFIVCFMMNKAAENDEEVSDIVTKRERIKQSIKLLFTWLRLYTKGSI